LRSVIPTASGTPSRSHIYDPVVTCLRSSPCSVTAHLITKPWTLNKTTGLASVFVKYRDAAGNESLVYAATIHVGPGSHGLHDIFLPVIKR
jgi:hypothetical protein